MIVSIAYHHILSLKNRKCDVYHFDDIKKDSKDGSSTPKLFRLKKTHSQKKPWVKKENCRVWGEERTKDAIYGVYLKKVRYQRPSAIVQIVQASGNHASLTGTTNSTTTTTSSSNGSANNSGSYRLPKQQLSSKFSTTTVANNNENNNNGKKSNSATKGVSDSENEDIAHLMWETVRVKVLKAGSLERIVEANYNDDNDVQATHLSVFLATYRAFAAAKDVIQEIIKIYRNCESEELKKAMTDCLHVWLDAYPEDFEQGAEGFYCLQKLVLPFAQEENLKSLSLKVQYKLRARRKMKKAASIHSLRTHTPLQIKTYSLLAIPEAHFAQQLTYIDKELFLNLRVWECLGGLWKRRCRCGSVVATVDQFNALSGRVVATILLDPSAPLHFRAKCLDKWIRIAQELRQLKNFSSLKAIIAALESNPVFRLSKLWHLISKDRLAIFTQLSQIFSEDNNRMAQRTLLETEGTAKYSTPSKSPREKTFFSRVLRGPVSSSRSTAVENDTPNGTIPYLGTFLTDLTFIDSAIPDTMDGLINFEKRRKEFEILAQLKLLQGSAKGYRLEEDPYFTSWFNSLLVLDDKTAFDLSTTIQPERNLVVKGHKKNDSFTSNSSSENLESALQRKGSIPSSNDSSLLYPNGTGSTGNGSSNSFTTSPSGDTSSIVVKVSSPSQGDIMYKSIMVNNADRTLKILALALEKLGLEDEDPKNYNLYQILPHKELKFPMNANVYYALDTTTTPGDIRLEARRLGTIINNNNIYSHGKGSTKSTKSN